jgi:hypothetical protein
LVKADTRLDDVVVIPEAHQSRPRLRGLAALGIYVALAVSFFGPMILPHLNDRVLTTLPGDWSLFAWAFRWWPYTVERGAYPLFTHYLWYPAGMNLSWTTAVPIPSLFLWPLTSLVGPVAAFNIASLLAPALSAWTAFLLFSRLTRRAFAASLAGGFVFGFSPYVMAQIVSGHLNLSLAMMIPLVAYLIVRYMQDDLGPWTFAALMTGCLVVQFGISTEIFATTALFALFMGAFGWFIAPGSRRRILRTGALFGAAFFVAALIYAPYLWAAFRLPEPYKPLFVHPMGPIFTSDLPRFFVPGAPEIFGRNFGQPGTMAWYFRLERFGWYLPLPLIGIVVHLWMTERRNKAVKVAVATVVLGVLLALGPYLGVHGNKIPLPWAVVQVLPLIKRAFPYRMMVFATLGLGACVAYWLAVSPRSWRRWVVFGVGAFLLLPNLASGLWTRDVRVPAFIREGDYRSELRPGEVVWIIDADGGSQMLWQAEAGMYFKMGAGFTGVTPPKLGADAQTVNRLNAGQVAPGDEAAIITFVRAHDVEAVIVGNEPAGVIDMVSNALGVVPVRTGGITLFKVP